MSIVRTDLRETRERAREVRFEPTAGISATNVQKAIEAIVSLPQPYNPTAVNAALSPYTVQAADTVLYVDSSAGPVQILLQATAARTGTLTIKDTGGAAFTNNITLTPSGAETIDGLAPVTINAPYGGYKLAPKTGGYTIVP